MPFVDRILFNGHIATQDIFKPRVAALAMKGERVVATGTDEEIVRLAEPGTVLENLGGAHVIPGLTDAHMHWAQTASALQQVNLLDAADRHAAVQRVAARARDVAPGVWIRGFGWSQDSWPDRRFPAAADLDAAVPHHPVYLASKSIHAAWANSAALRLAGITASTPDPRGGQIMRDATGAPTGILLEGPAMELVERLIPEPTLDELVGAMAVAQRAALGAGLTGFHDFDGQDCFRALQVLRERGALGLRVLKNINKPDVDHVLEAGFRWGFGDDWIRLGGLKLFADGALGPRTAAMLQPYDGEPDNYGIVLHDKEEMAEWVSRASAAGLPATIHAIGDRAVHDVLDVYEHVRAEEAARGETPAARRHRVEHVQIIQPDDVPRFGQLDIIASMQPIHATSDYEMADRYWGNRARWSYNPRLFLKQGVMVAFGSDSPVDTFRPLDGIHAAITRRRADGAPGPDGWYPAARIPIEDALRGYTVGPAYAAGMEDRLGKLAPGFLADLVLLDRDLFAIDPDEMLATAVLGTMVGGVWRHGGV